MSARLSQATLSRMQALFRVGYSIRAVADALELHRETVRRYAGALQPSLCNCGKPINHRGNCSARYLRSAVHKEVLAKVAADFVEKPRPLRARPRHAPQRRNSWPYCVEERPGLGNALIASVNSLVSRRLLDDQRADICQDLILLLLGGGLRPEDLTAGMVTKATKERMNMFDERTTYRLDAPLFRDGEDVVRLMDTIPSDYEPILAKRYARKNKIR